MAARRFTATVRAGERGRIVVPVPFDPNAVWAAKARHHVGGTVDGRRVRGVVEPYDGGWAFALGAAWLRGGALRPGDEVRVEIEPEGPQRDELAADVSAALAANPQAGEFFDGLAQFYRKAYLRWVDGTKRRPDLRAQRIGAMVELLAAGVKDVRGGPPR